MSTLSRTSGSLEASGSFVEERSKTFVVPPRQVESADGASACELPTNQDLETLVNLVNSKFEKKKREMKSEMREEFEWRLERDKKHNEEIIVTLRRDLSQLTKIAQECDGLKEMQRSMQREINQLHERNMALRDENMQLKFEAARAKGLIVELDNIKEENETLKREKALLDIKAAKLESTIAEKEQEIANMKMFIDSQYKRIKLDLTNTRDRFHSEQETIHAGMKQQNLMLSEISAAVKNITSEMGETGKKRNTGSRTSVARGKGLIDRKAASETSFNKLPGYNPKKQK